MHSPKAVAHEIYMGKKKKKNGQYRDPFMTIWHNDPETDGTDDSCGWFMRERHGDKEMLEKIKKALDFDFTRTFKSEKTTYYTGWFHPETGEPNFSTMGIVLNMYGKASWEFFKYNRKKHFKFMNKWLFEILHFAENTSDSLMNDILGTFRKGANEKWKRNDALERYASIIYGELLRKTRPWYKHPKWHIHHWSIQFHPWQKFRRRFLDKCSRCGKRGFPKGTAAYGNWSGNEIWHEHCNNIK